MKIIGVYINLRKLFEEAQYWTQNRVILQGNPNKSNVVNEAYAMTEDDKEYFWNNYIERAAADLNSEMYRINHKLNMGFQREVYYINAETDAVLYYGYVEDKFPTQQLLKSMKSYLLQRVLRDWYRMKGLAQEVQLIEAELSEITAQITRINTKHYDGEPLKISMNDGLRIDERMLINKAREELSKVDDVYYAGLESLIEDMELRYETDSNGSEVVNLYLTLPDGTETSQIEIEDGYLIVKI